MCVNIQVYFAIHAVLNHLMGITNRDSCLDICIDQSVQSLSNVYWYYYTLSNCLCVKLDSTHIIKLCNPHRMAGPHSWQHQFMDILIL